MATNPKAIDGTRSQQSYVRRHVAVEAQHVRGYVFSQFDFAPARIAEVTHVSFTDRVPEETRVKPTPISPKLTGFLALLVFSLVIAAYSFIAESKAASAMGALGMAVAFALASSWLAEGQDEREHHRNS